MLIDHIRVTIENGLLEEKEIQYYIDAIRHSAKGKSLKNLSFRIADDYMDLRYSFQGFPFERIRRVSTQADDSAKRYIG